MTERGIHKNNAFRIRNLMKRAEAGEKLVLAFLGGSITQGALSSVPETCYAYLVYQWWRKQYPAAEFVYVNGGIGGTSSQFGTARVQEDILDANPDFVVVDFTVNDKDTDLFMETYESLVRRLLKASSSPAVMALCNVYYDSGVSAMNVHRRILEHYQIPYVSMEETVYRDIQEGVLNQEDVTPDGLHPHDRGHRMLADWVIRLLQVIQENQEDEDEFLLSETSPLTPCGYEGARRIQNADSACVCQGFEKDLREKEGILDIFSKGWEARQEGASIHIEAEGSCLAVQYRKSVHHPAPVAMAYVDGNREKGVLLDGNFEETWGDCLFITTLLHHGVEGKHDIDIEIIRSVETEETSFYLVSVIAASP